MAHLFFESVLVPPHLLMSAIVNSDLQRRCREPDAEAKKTKFVLTLLGVRWPGRCPCERGPCSGRKVTLLSANKLPHTVADTCRKTSYDTARLRTDAVFQIMLMKETSVQSIATDWYYRASRFT